MFWECSYLPLILALFLGVLLGSAAVVFWARSRRLASVSRETMTGPRDAKFEGDKHKSSVDFPLVEWGRVLDLAHLCNCKPSDVVRASVAYSFGAFLADRSLPSRLNTYGHEPQK